MPRYAILASNGFGFEFVAEVEAVSPKAARDWFKATYAGDYRTENFRVSRRPSAPAAVATDEARS